MKTKYDVTIDRFKWIGGSDIPAIMGISPFTTRFDLLLFKAELKENDFKGNEYTRYGQVMEPKIRNYINKEYKLKYRPSKHEFIEKRYRCHTDGEDKNSILEIKTTSKDCKTIRGYKIYLVQLLFYMYNIGKEEGKLVVYIRPEDFNEDLDTERIKIFNIRLEDYKDLVQEIEEEVIKFKKDIKRVLDNPLIEEWELDE